MYNFSCKQLLNYNPLLKANLFLMTRCLNGIWDDYKDESLVDSFRFPLPSTVSFHSKGRSVKCWSHLQEANLSV